MRLNCRELIFNLVSTVHFQAQDKVILKKSKIRRQLCSHSTLLLWATLQAKFTRVSQSVDSMIKPSILTLFLIQPHNLWPHKSRIHTNQLSHCTRATSNRKIENLSSNNVTVQKREAGGWERSHWTECFLSLDLIVLHWIDYKARMRKPIQWLRIGCIHCPSYTIGLMHFAKQSRFKQFKYLSRLFSLADKWPGRKTEIILQYKKGGPVLKTGTLETKKRPKIIQRNSRALLYTMYGCRNRNNCHLLSMYYVWSIRGIRGNVTYWDTHSISNRKTWGLVPAPLLVWPVSCLFPWFIKRAQQTHLTMSL